MRIKTFISLTADCNPDAHILVRVLGRAMHIGNGIGNESHHLRLPYIITDVTNEYSFREDIERSRF